MKRIIQTPLLWIILLTMLPLWAFFVPGLPVTHDGVDHVARIANFYQSLGEGNIFPRWAGNLNWGYGHPILMFLYPLPSYAASLFHFIGLSFVDSTKMVFGLGTVASGFCMYLWLAGAYGKKAGVVGSLLYVFAPYRFVDLYVRGAIGEHVAFIFPPLIFYFLHKRSYIGYSLALAALILSHNAIALMFIPIIGLYALYLLLYGEKDKVRVALSFLLYTSFGFGLSAFYWVPAFFEGKYTLRDIVTSGQIASRFVPLSWFLYSPWTYGQGDTITKSLGLMQWAGVIATIVAAWKVKEKKVKVVLLWALGLLLFTFFIMSTFSKPVWDTVTTLQKFQFPWRFLSVSVFAAAAMGGISAELLTKRMKTGGYVVIALCALIIAVTIPMWHPKDYISRGESFYTGIYMSTTDTGESSPVWSVRFMEHTPDAPLEVIDGAATITNGFRSSTVHEYSVELIKPTLFMENTVYFPDWKIYIDGVVTEIQFQNPNYRGLMTFQVPQGTHTIRVIFENTRLRKAADVMSWVSLGIIGCIVVVSYLWRKRK